MNSERASSPAKWTTTEAMKSGGSCAKSGAHRDGRDSRFDNARRPAPAAEHKAVISATVESADVLQVRRAIFQTGGGAVGILKTAPVPHSSRVRIFIEMQLGALDPIMTAIMRAVAACEFGRVIRL
jgi:hypothetical protein